MTKMVRIENADMNTSVGVLVEIWEKVPAQVGDSPMAPQRPDVFINSIELPNPTDFTGMETFLTSTRYFLVKEFTKNA